MHPCLDRRRDISGWQHFGKQRRKCIYFLYCARSDIRTTYDWRTHSNLRFLFWHTSGNHNGSYRLYAVRTLNIIDCFLIICFWCGVHIAPSGASKQSQTLHAMVVSRPRLEIRLTSAILLCIRQKIELKKYLLKQVPLSWCTLDNQRYSFHSVRHQSFCQGDEILFH